MHVFHNECCFEFVWVLLQTNLVTTSLKSGKLTVFISDWAVIPILVKYVLVVHKFWMTVERRTTISIYIWLGSDTDIGEICTCSTKVLNDCWKAYKKPRKQNKTGKVQHQTFDEYNDESIYLFIFLFSIYHCSWYWLLCMTFIPLHLVLRAGKVAMDTHGNVSCMRAATHFLCYFSLAVRCGNDVRQSNFNWPYSIYLFKLSGT